MQGTDHRFIGALATRALVGRDEELAAIQAAISNPAADTSAVLAFVADGGIGKTRILQDTYARLGGIPISDDPLNQPLAAADRPWANPAVLCLPLIDVANPILHRKVAFFRRLRELFQLILPVEQHGFFQTFDQAFDKYQKDREEAAAYSVVQRRIADIETSFQQDYERLTETYRIVWLIDTMEQLYGIRQPIATILTEIALPEPEIEQTTYHWLMNFIGGMVRNTVFLLAGRPQPGRWLKDLADFQQRGGNVAIKYLKEFSQIEMQAYFQQLSEQLRADGQTIMAKYLAAMQDDPERTAIIARLTNGNPIRLALYLDVMANSPSEPEEFQRSLEEIQALSPEETDRLREQVDNLLLDYIESGIGHPENEVVNYLLVARRGINAKRLQRLSGGTLEECQETLDHLSRLSFVKTRFSKVFLHDELYTMQSRRLARKQRESEREYLDRKVELKQIYKLMIDFCQAQVEKRTAQIAKTQARQEKGEAFSENDRENLRRWRYDRPRYQAETLHYQLYLNPMAGFYDTYYTLAEHAFLGQDIDLDGYLQSELDIFFFGSASEANRLQVGLDEAAWARLRLDVEEERTARWIKRITQFGKLSHAQVFAQQLTTNYHSVIAADHQASLAARPLGHEHDLFDLETRAYACFAAILKGDTVGEGTLSTALNELLSVIKALEALMQSDQIEPAARTRWLNTIAQCYLYHGYGHASQGIFRVAQQSYGRAKHIVQRTGHAALHAEINNDFSRVLGELGLFHEAEIYCQQGERTRRNLGFDYALALSLNTLALIRTLNHRSVQAVGPARMALKLFRQINNPRGIVLAIKQLAEANRSVWLSDPSIQPLSLLVESEALLKEALEIIETGVVQEQLRGISINLELGSLYGDWLLIADSAERQQLLVQAVDYLGKAARLAEQHGALAYHIDAILEQAYAYFYAGDPGRANAMLAIADAATPPDYLINSEHPLKITSDMNLMLFDLLSKRMNLQARIDEQERPERLLEDRMIGATYSQLFSESSWHFGEHKARVQTLLDTDVIDSIAARIGQARMIIERYHLGEIEKQLETGSLEVVRIIEKSTAAQSSGDLDYLYGSSQ